jgi:FimV-like protein
MQLDLAAAYVDIGDKKNARKLLKQILRDGDESQKHKAEEIMLLIR